MARSSFALILVKACLSLGAMLFTFLGLSDLLGAHVPAIGPALGEAAAYCVSAVWGVFFYDWLSKWMGDPISDEKRNET